MDDLIGRKAFYEAMKKREEMYAKGHCSYDAYNYRVSAEIVANVPSVPAVPLDKLCEWLANSFSDPPCCTLENVRCKMECRGFTQMDYSECWRYVLTKWMEGLDAADKR